MKKLITTLDELQKYLKVDSTFKIENLFPYQDSAIEKYLIDVLGDDLTDSLVLWYNDSEPEEDTDLTTLLPFVQRVVAKFAFYQGAPNFDLRLTESGFGVVSNQTLAPASKERVNRFVESLESEGWDAVEMLLRFLELNAEQYPLWTESEAYTMQLRNFINSAEEFDKYVNIGKSRLKFRKMRNTMDNVELLQVIPVISQPLATTIKEELLSGSPSAAITNLLPMLCRAVANLTAAHDIDQKYKLTGEHYLSEVRKIIDASPDSYPDYRDSIYVADRNYQRFENSEDNSFFVAGQ